MASLLETDERFLDWIADEFDIPRDQVAMTDRLVHELQLDSLELFRLTIMLEVAVPGFELPEQMDLSDVHLADVVHYARAFRDRELGS